MTTNETRQSGDSRTEKQRRARVVKGWGFRRLSPDEVTAIRLYLDGGPVPEGYEAQHKEVK